MGSARNEMTRRFISGVGKFIRRILRLRVASRRVAWNRESSVTWRKLVSCRVALCSVVSRGYKRKTIVINNCAIIARGKRDNEKSSQSRISSRPFNERYSRCLCQRYLYIAHAADAANMLKPTCAHSSSFRTVYKRAYASRELPK